MPEARDPGSSGIQRSRGEPGRGLGVQHSGAGPPESRWCTAEGAGRQHGGARGSGSLECDSEEEALEPPRWAGSPELRSWRAGTGRLESPGGNPGRPCSPGGCTEAVCRLASPGYAGSGDPAARRRPLPGLRRLRLSRAGRGSLATPMSHLGGSGMHQETPGLLPFLRGGARRLGLFLPALLPPPSGCLGSGSGSARRVPKSAQPEPACACCSVTAAKEVGICLVGSTRQAGGLICSLGEVETLLPTRPGSPASGVPRDLEELCSSQGRLRKEFLD